MRPFEAFQSSFLQQPALLWCAALVGLVLVALRRSTARSTVAFCMFFGMVPFFDAWLTADDVVGVGVLGPTAAVVVATFFVIVGDLRVFLFLQWATPEGKIAPTRGGAGRAVVLSLVVPVATAIVRAFLPDAPWRARVTFLFYEVAFVVFVLSLRAAGGVALGRGATIAWGRDVLRYVVAYYALWATADALIVLLHLDAAYLLRVLANVLYYGGLLAVVSFTAPRGPRSPGPLAARPRS